MSENVLPEPSIEEAIEALIAADTTLTYRAIARRVGLAPSSLTRSTARRDAVEAGIKKQNELRSWRKRAGKQSESKLIEKLASQDVEIERLRAEVQRLQASHKALILVAGEMGGMSAWARFYNDYERAALESVHAE